MQLSSMNNEFLFFIEFNQMPLPRHFAIRALKLYRRIIKLHLRKLPTQMRGIGKS